MAVAMSACCIEGRTVAGEHLVSVSTPSSGVAVIEMHDEAGKNAMSEPFAEALLESFRTVAAWDTVKVAVLLGLPEVFSSGASPDVLAAIIDGSIAPSDLLLSRALLDLPVPTIAAMEGHALGGGLALGLCADVVIIARRAATAAPS